MNENTLYASSWFTLGLTLVALVFISKGCNDSDNHLVQAAVERGCTVSVDKQGHHEFTCPEQCHE
jgi:hypothetical protein